MKIIISHDVDHITNWEHIKDLIIPKYFVRNTIELIISQISLKEYCLRLVNIFQSKWHNIPELICFDRKEMIPSTFFIAVKNGLGLSYSLKDAEFWINKILQEGFDVGLHGIAFDNYENLKIEYDIFKKTSNQKNFGIRIHYLKMNNCTIEFINNLGYSFDTTVYGMKNPYKVGDIWEFPIHIMDTNLFYENSRWQNCSLIQVKDKTIKIIEEARKKDIKYFTILFHSRVFHRRFASWEKWYLWLIEYLKDNGFEFISYKKAIGELETQYF